MKKVIVFLLCTIAIAQTSNAQTSSGSFTHDGVQRDYELHIPANYNSANAVPLILNFHGFGGNGAGQLNTSNFAAVADTAGFIVVSPTGTPLGGLLNHWNVGGWTQTSTTDDISFASALIDTIAANYNVDLMRVYSTGFSNGGFFSHRLACELGNRIAAIASVSGTFTPQMEAACSPSHPTPVLQIHGTADAVVPYPGTTVNGGMTSVDNVISYWITANNCNPTPTTTALPDISPGDGTVEHIVYTGGNASVNVELMKITDGAHTWPGNAGANQDITASIEIWKFFSRYTNTAVGISQELSIENKVNVYPNPVVDYLSINSELNRSLEFKLLSFLGQELLSGKIKNSKERIDISHLANGSYVLMIENTPFKILKTN